MMGQNELDGDAEDGGNPIQWEQFQPDAQAVLNPGPIVPLKVPRPRRSKKQMEGDKVIKDAEKAEKNATKEREKLTAELAKKSKKTAAPKSDPQADPITMTLNGVEVPVIKAGSAWSLEESKALLNVMCEIEKRAEKSGAIAGMTGQHKWCQLVPKMMAKEFGSSRFTPGVTDKMPDGALQYSPYQKRFIAIRSFVSDKKHLEVDGPHEDRAMEEAPSGGGNDEDGNPDPAMIAYEERVRQKEERFQDRLKKKWPVKTNEMIELISHYEKLFPNSIAGSGIVSESDLMSGNALMVFPSILILLFHFSLT
jgi:hypothetical protein